MKNEFINELIESYNNLSENEKMKEAIKELKEIYILFEKLNKDLGINKSLPKANNKDKFDKTAYSEEEFLEYIYTYILLTKEQIGNYVDGMTDILYE